MSWTRILLGPRGCWRLSQAQAPAWTTVRVAALRLVLAYACSTFGGLRLLLVLPGHWPFRLAVWGSVSRARWAAILFLLAQLSHMFSCTRSPDCPLGVARRPSFPNSTVLHLLTTIAALVSRQFRELSRARIESLLTSFTTLIPPNSQHTSVETADVRYVYQPLDDLYILLVTNKASNILQVHCLLSRRIR